MRKTLLLLLLAVLFSFGTRAQINLTFYNNSTCSVKFTITGFGTTMVPPGGTVPMNMMGNWTATVCWVNCSTICATITNTPSPPPGCCQENADLASCNACAQCQFTYLPNCSPPLTPPAYCHTGKITLTP